MRTFFIPEMQLFAWARCYLTAVICLRRDVAFGAMLPDGAMLPAARCCFRNDVCLWHDMCKILCDIKKP